MRLVPRILLYMTCKIRASEVESAGYGLAGEMVFGNSGEAFKSLSDSNLNSYEATRTPTIYLRGIYLLQNSDSYLHAAAYTLKPPIYNVYTNSGFSLSVRSSHLLSH
jgi:hypothetical protein